MGRNAPPAFMIPCLAAYTSTVLGSITPTICSMERPISSRRFAIAFARSFSSRKVRRSPQAITAVLSGCRAACRSKRIFAVAGSIAQSVSLYASSSRRAAPLTMQTSFNRLFTWNSSITVCRLSTSPAAVRSS